MGLGPAGFSIPKGHYLKKKPNYIFFVKFYLRNIVERVRSTLGFEGMIVVESQGHKRRNFSSLAS